MSQENNIPPEDIQQEHLDNKQAVEISSSTEQPVTHNPSTVTEQNMEVHHHAHNPAAPHHKKNWK